MKKLVYSLICSLFICLNTLYSANRYWISSGGTANFNNPSNWSITSGGTGGASAPGASDIAIFNGSGVGPCTINAASNVAGISILAGYTGTISFNSGITLTIGASGFSQASGTFTGNNGNITLNGSFSLSGGTFTSTSGNLTITGGYTYSAGTFNHNSGTVTFNGTQNFSGNMTFYDVVFSANGCDYNITAGQNLTSVLNVTIVVRTGTGLIPEI
jgi:hypothetical protein